MGTQATRPDARRGWRPAGGALALAAALTLTGALAGCTGDDEPAGGQGDEPDPGEVLDAAAQTLADTSGLSLELATGELPDGVIGLLSAEGVASDAPAFDGTLRVPVAGNTFDVPVISVDDTVYAEIPLTPGWSEVDPAEYGAPDPATFLDADQGFPGLLPATEEVEVGDSVRGGEGNREVLTEYAGTVPGEAVAGLIPSAEGTFEATYTISDEGELRSATLTGAFYPDADPLTYTVDLTDYGSDPEITAP